MKIETVPIKALKHTKTNPRTITKDQFAKLCENLERDADFFFARPCLVNRTSEGLTVYAGNQRLRAAKKLGYEVVPCIIEDDLAPDVIKKRSVLDNIHHGEFDWDLLANEFSPIELLELGMLPDEMGFDTSAEVLDDGSGQEENKSKCVICPKCGHEFTK